LPLSAVSEQRILIRHNNAKKVLKTPSDMDPLLPLSRMACTLAITSSGDAA